MKRIRMLLLALLLPVGAFAEQSEWEYPLAPEIIKDPSQYITLSNRNVLLDSHYIPNDLVTASVRRAVGTGKMQLRKAANEAIVAMFDAASEAGYSLYLKSAYRAYSTQKTMYYNRLQKLGRDDGLVSFPGASDHQTGLGVDILNLEWTYKDGMNEKFASTAEAQWMEAHCHEFGFILRYMSDKEEITMIKFEPWHFRYVGVEVATYIMEKHISLEEFTQEWQDYLAQYEKNGGNFNELLRERARMNDPTVVDHADDGEEELSIFY